MRSQSRPGVTRFSYSPGGFTMVASNATIKDSTASLLCCYTGPHSTSDACNADTTVVTMVSTGRGDAPPTGLALGLEILHFIPQTRWRELFGPGFIFKFGATLSPSQINALLPLHRSHVHIAILP